MMQVANPSTGIREQGQTPLWPPTCPSPIHSRFLRMNCKPTSSAAFLARPDSSTTQRGQRVILASLLHQPVALLVKTDSHHQWPFLYPHLASLTWPFSEMEPSADLVSRISTETWAEAS